MLLSCFVTNDVCLTCLMIEPLPCLFLIDKVSFIFFLVPLLIQLSYFLFSYTHRLFVTCKSVVPWSVLLIILCRRSGGDIIYPN